MTDLTSPSVAAPTSLPRRTFLRVAGASAATVGLVLAGCGKNNPAPVAAPTSVGFSSASDSSDIRIFNYLSFVKQLEYALYDKVVSTFPSDLPAAEQAYFRDLREHELVQLRVLANTAGPNALFKVPFDLTTASLTSRAGVLAAAKKLEDTGAGAFLGVLPYLSDGTALALVAKMASVEARHAALISDLLTPGSFAGPDVVQASGAQAGQALALTPTQVATALTPFLPTLTIDISSLPTA